MGTYANLDAAQLEALPQFAYSRARVRRVTFVVTLAALLAGAVASAFDRWWALLAAAVVFGWSKIGGA